MRPRHDHRIRTLPGHRDIHTHMFDNVCLGHPDTRAGTRAAAAGVTTSRDLPAMPASPPTAAPTKLASPPPARAEQADSPTTTQAPAPKPASPVTTPKLTASDPAPITNKPKPEQGTKPKPQPAPPPASFPVPEAPPVSDAGVDSKSVADPTPAAAIEESVNEVPFPPCLCQFTYVSCMHASCVDYEAMRMQQEPVEVDIGFSGTRIDAHTCMMLNLPLGSVWGGNASEVRAEYIEGKSKAMGLPPGTLIAGPRAWLRPSVSGTATPLSSASFPQENPHRGFQMHPAMMYAVPTDIKTPPIGNTGGAVVSL